MGEPVAYFEIIGGEPATQHAFYEALFGWQLAPIESTGGSYARVTGAGVDGGVGAFQGGPGYVTVYVHADDPAAALERAVELGATEVKPAREVSPGITAAIFRDPAGNLIGLMAGAAGS